MRRRFILLGLVGLVYSVSSLAHRDLWGDCDREYYCWHILESASRGKIDLLPRPIAPEPQPDTFLKKVARFLGIDSVLLKDLRFDLKYRDQPLKGIEGRYDPILRSYRYYPSAIPTRPRFSLTLSHGIGAKTTSHSGTTATWLRTFLGLDKTGRRLHSEREAKGSPALNLYAETFDLPESGNSTAFTNARRFGDFRTLQDTRFLLAQTQKRLQLELPKSKRVWLAQSASCGLVADVNAHHPGLLHGQIFIGFLHPEVGFQNSVDAFNREASLPTHHPDYFVANWPAFNWVNRMYGQMTWHHGEGDPFHGTPTLVLIGEHDSEVSVDARRHYRDLSAKYPHIYYKEISGAGHNILSPVASTRYQPDNAIKAIFEFLDAIDN